MILLLCNDFDKEIVQRALVIYDSKFENSVLELSEDSKGKIIRLKLIIESNFERNQRILDSYVWSEHLFKAKFNLKKLNNVFKILFFYKDLVNDCLLYTSPSPRDS